MLRHFSGWLAILVITCCIQATYAQNKTLDNAVAQWSFDQSLIAKPKAMTLEVFDADNKLANNAAVFQSADANTPANVTLPAQHFLRIQGTAAKPICLTGEQTIWTRIKLGSNPQGIIWSRHRPMDGLRGIELGLTAKTPWDPNGPKPCLTISGGDRDNIAFLVAKNPLKSGVWYDLFVDYIPGKAAKLTVIESLTGALIEEVQITKDIPAQIKADAGQYILTLGARRNHSKDNSHYLPANSSFAGFGVWDKTLDATQQSELIGKPITQDKPAALAPDAQPSRKAVTFHVNAKSGSDSADGLTPQTAFATINRATQSLVPGDTVLIAPGVYYEQVRIVDAGTSTAPITIKATDTKKNAVIITLADPAIRQGKKQWELVDNDLKLYSIAMDHFPARVLYDQIGLMGYPDLQTLKTFTLYDEYPGPPHGFTFDAKAQKLYVRLDASGQYGSTNPNEHVMAVSPVNANGYNGQHLSPGKLDANLVIEGDGDGFVEIQGLTLETPGAVGILSMRNNVIIKDCTFIGCRFGVGGHRQSPDESQTTNFITIDGCDYSNKPVFMDMVQMIQRLHDKPVAQKHPFFWWHRKGHNTNNQLIKNDETGILGNVGSHWTLKNSDIHNAFEGIATWGVSWAKHLTITNNRFAYLVDNAIETENHAADVTIAHNWIEDVFEPISWQPLGGTPWPGPVFIHDNVIVQSEAFGKLWKLVDHTPGVFKIGANGKNWAKPHMGATGIDKLNSKISKRFVVVPDEGFVAYHNTIFSPLSNLLTLPNPNEGEFKRELINFRFFNNIIVTEQLFKDDNWKGSGMEFDGNLNVCLNSQSQSANLTAGRKGKVLHQIDQLGFANPQNADFSLQNDSPAFGVGTRIPGLFTADRPVGADISTVKHPAN
jgi:hypothetical protein